MMATLKTSNSSLLNKIPPEQYEKFDEMYKNSAANAGIYVGIVLTIYVILMSLLLCRFARRRKMLRNHQLTRSQRGSTRDRDREEKIEDRETPTGQSEGEGPSSVNGGGLKFMWSRRSPLTSQGTPTKSKPKQNLLRGETEADSSDHQYPNGPEISTESEQKTANRPNDSSSSSHSNGLLCFCFGSDQRLFSKSGLCCAKKKSSSSKCSTSNPELIKIDTNSEKGIVAV